MNKLILLVFVYVLGSTVPTYAQFIVNRVNINTLDVQYIELIGYNRSSTEASVWIDFGRNIDYTKSSEFLKPVNDQESVRFSSVVEALNYCYKMGWELVESYMPSPNSSRHYILRRISRAAK